MLASLEVRTAATLCACLRGRVSEEADLFGPAYTKAISYGPAAEVLAAAEARGDREQALFGDTNVGVPEYYEGKFASSLAHGERAIALYDPLQHHGHVRTLGNDQGISALIFSAQNLWALGQPDAALARARETVALTPRLEDPFSLAFALFFETCVHWIRRDVVAQRERGAEVIALSEAQGFPFWLGVGRVFHAAARVMAGGLAGFPEILDGMALAAETGTKRAHPGSLPFWPTHSKPPASSPRRRARSQPVWPSPHRQASRFGTPTSTGSTAT